MKELYTVELEYLDDALKLINEEFGNWDLVEINPQKADVLVAWLSKLATVVFFISFPEISLAQEPSCERLSRGARLEDPYLDLQKLIDEISSFINEPQKKGLAKLFHPRAKVKDSLAKTINIILSKKHKKPWNLSLFRVFELTNPNKSRILFSCDSSE